MKNTYNISIIYLERIKTGTKLSKLTMICYFNLILSILMEHVGDISCLNNCSPIFF